VSNLHDNLTSSTVADGAVLFRYLPILFLKSLTDMMTPNFGSQK